MTFDGENAALSRQDLGLGMAEMRIPTNLLPAEMLRKLEEIVSNFSSRNAPSVPMLSSTSTSSMLPVSTTAPPSSSSSPSSCGMTTSSSSSSSSSSFPPSSASSSSLTSSSFSSSLSSTLSSFSHAHSFKCSTNASKDDETDGAINDSVVHAIQPHPSERITVTTQNIMDESDIVRIFEDEDEDESAIHKPCETVRIFPEKGRASDCDIVPVLSPLTSTNSSFRSDSVHIHDVPSNFRNHPPPSIMPSTSPRQRLDTPIVAPSPLRPASALDSMPHHSDTKAGVLERTCSPQPPSGHTNSRSIREHPRVVGRHRQFPSFSDSARRSPELPTPPETPDNDDDEVFSYDAICDDVSKRRAFDIHRNIIESTPRRDHALSRHNSDRSIELRRQVGQQQQGSSPFSPAQRLSELCVGDRQGTRKRLSFEEDDIRHSSSMPRPQYTSLSSVDTSAPPTHSRQDGNRKDNPSPSYYSLTPPSPSPSIYQSFSNPSLHKNQPVAMSVQRQSPLTLDVRDQPITSSYTASHSPVRDVLRKLETVSRQKTLGPLRSRLHSDGDDVTDGHAQWLSQSDTPIREQLQSHRQTFSHGKRRRIELEESNSPSTSQSTHQDQDPTVACCPCAKIEQYFLQIAEGAYKRVRMDNDLADFRKDLAVTNEILRESLENLKNFKQLCGHHRTRDTSSPPSSPVASSSSSPS